MQSDRELPVTRGYGWDPAWTGWHLSGTAVWMGALAGLVAAVLFSLLATAVGAHKAVDDRVLKFSDLGAATIIFGVLGAFFAAVIGGWTAGRISGARRAEPAIHHGVAAWLVSMGIVILLASLGGAHVFAGGYLNYLAPLGAPAPANVPVDPTAAIAIRNAAASAILAMLVGLMGATIGGWMASGEPMHPYHYRTRDRHHESSASDVRRASL